MQHVRKLKSRLLLSTGVAVALASGALNHSHVQGARFPATSTPASAAPVTHPVEHAIGVFVTPRGQNYLYTHFDEILQRNGYSLTDGAFPYIHYKAPEAFSMDNLRSMLSSKPQALQSMETVRSALLTYLSSFHLNNPHLEVKVLNLAYQLKFNRFGIRTDEVATKALGDRSGLVLVVEAEVPEFRISAKRIQIGDLANQVLGVWGVSNLWMAFKSPTVPLMVQMPFKIMITENGIQTETMPMITNIDKLTLSSGFDRPLSLPDVGLRIDGHEMHLRKSQVEDVLFAQRDGMLKSLQGYLKAFTTDTAPGIINQKVTHAYDPERGEQDLMSPPGAPADLAPDQKFQWGIRLADIRVKQSSMYFELSAFLEDPNAPKTPLLPAVRGLSAPQAKEHDPQTYDVGIAVNENLLNRALQLSHARGYFNVIPLSGSDSLTLVKPPLVVVDGSKGPNRAILKLDVTYKVNQWLAERLAVHNPLHMKFDLIIRLDRTAKGLKLVEERVDVDSLEIDPASLRHFGLKKMVVKQVKDLLAKTNTDFASTEHLLSDEVPLPQALYGVPLELAGFASKDGFMNLFLNLGGQK